MESNPTPNRALFLVGEYDASLDGKNRFLIPIELRREIVEARSEQSLICRFGRNRVVWLYPELYYRELITQRKRSLTPGADEEAFNEANFGMIYRIAWDNQGRVVMPEKVIARAGIGKHVSLIGAGDHIVLRNRDDWEQRAQTLLSTLDQISDREREQNTVTQAAQPHV